MNATRQDITEIITSTIRDVHMDVKLKHERTGVNMMYDFIKDEVLVDCERVQAACAELSEQMPLKTYVEVLTLHELGHALDREALLASLDLATERYEVKQLVITGKKATDLPYIEMLLEEHESDILFEKTAWNNAEMLNRFFQVVDWNCFETVKAHSMATYEALLHADLKLYEHLVKSTAAADVPLLT
ncbi:integrase [Sporosarcina oncorhynchi]|uniref:Integrase n=1 Tax=Sporosarcina oncorhynchi TaxID=3056444 RepID=A0ABZ0L5D8_9BACL|nr:integrase [Sporosarcina sp. T2O-4]WOV87163.1 integrase [Sporosarcina sp. T2O-4]